MCRHETELHHGIRRGVAKIGQRRFPAIGGRPGVSFPADGLYTSGGGTSVLLLRPGMRIAAEVAVEGLPDVQADRFRGEGGSRITSRIWKIHHGIGTPHRIIHRLVYNALPGGTAPNGDSLHLVTKTVIVCHVAVICSPPSTRERRLLDIVGVRNTGYVGIRRLDQGYGARLTCGGEGYCRGMR